MKAFYDKENGYLSYKCHNCFMHAIPVGASGSKNWNWNGDLEKPTITPSVKHFYPESAYKEHPGLPPFCCHYVITDGIINYCPDCTHDKAGQSLELKDMER